MTQTIPAMSPHAINRALRRYSMETFDEFMENLRTRNYEFVAESRPMVSVCKMYCKSSPRRPIVFLLATDTNAVLTIFPKGRWQQS